MECLLLQINGVDVCNRYQAERLFTEAGELITVLVSRPHGPVSNPTQPNLT